MEKINSEYRKERKRGRVGNGGSMTDPPIGNSNRRVMEWKFDQMDANR